MLKALLGHPAPRVQSSVAATALPAGAPPRRLALGELTAGIEAARLLRAAPWLATAPRGDGSTVIDLPGWLAPEASNIALRRWLRWLGYDSRSWGLGTNDGRVEHDTDALVRSLEADAGKPPVALVGWSLGGVVAREVARTVPDRVTRVITYGSPVVGGPTHTRAAARWGREECERVEALAARRDAERPIQVPITAIYTRRDGIVDWRACIDRTSPDVTHVEVGATHLSLGIDPDVWWTVARVLAEGKRA